MVVLFIQEALRHPRQVDSQTVVCQRSIQLHCERRELFRDSRPNIEPSVDFLSVKAKLQIVEKQFEFIALEEESAKAFVLDGNEGLIVVIVTFLSIFTAPAVDSDADSTLRVSRRFPSASSSLQVT
jgi:hypothetical protein